MSLTLYYHPFASFCQKVLIALYENGTPFTPHFVDLGDEASRAAFLKIWPIAKFPVLRDDARNVTVPESNIIIEYLGLHYAGSVELVPRDAELAWQVRLEDRFYDLHVNEPMAKIVTNKLRPLGSDDAFGADQAFKALRTAYGLIERKMETNTWAVGENFSMGDCAAAPALYYANLVLPFGGMHPNTNAYLARLMERPSFARVVAEAEPYRVLFPK
jgi:glutathione S-transferase